MRGELLSTAREKAGLTLKELAARTGTSYQFLSKIEQDKRGLSLDTLRRLDKALKLPSKTLLQIIRCGEGGAALSLCAALWQSLQPWTA